MYITDLFDREDVRSFFNQTNVAIVVSNPKEQDNPMVYVNQTFVEMTGYSKEESVGRNCRFLQGADTDEASVMAIRTALKEKTKISITVKNYRKDGTAFWNSLNITPIFDDQNQIKYFLGVQEDVTEVYTQSLAMKERIRELENKVKRFEREIDLKLNGED